MLTEKAEAHFGTRAAIARALGGSRSASAVYQWDEVVPLAAARRLANISGGVLPVEEGLYDEFGKIKAKPRKSKRKAA